MLIFVYGSLKRGYGLHHLLEDQAFIGCARTKPLYRLFDLGSYPGIVDWPDGLSVHGEVHRVTAGCLLTLDDAEGVEDGLYARREIQIDPSSICELKLNEPVHAWFWLGQVSNCRDCRTTWPTL
jgi:gamma-glutamylcyclotransferase (GGCT)/AIG2-like uncharacterized protein YtfP